MSSAKLLTWTPPRTALYGEVSLQSWALISKVGLDPCYVAMVWCQAQAKGELRAPCCSACAHMLHCCWASTEVVGEDADHRGPGAAQC